MILTTMDQDRLAQLLAAEQRQGRLTLTPPPARSALIAALLSQRQGGPNGLLGSLGSLGQEFLEAMKRSKKKKPQVLTVPQPAPTTLGPERSR